MFTIAGLVVGGAAVALFREYRRAFFQNPRIVVSLELLLMFLRQPGPGWLAAFCLLAGAWMIGIGVYLAVGEIFELFAARGVL